MVCLAISIPRYVQGFLREPSIYIPGEGSGSHEACLRRSPEFASQVIRYRVRRHDRLV